MAASSMFHLALAQSSEPSRQAVTKWSQVGTFWMNLFGWGWWAGICEPYYCWWILLTYVTRKFFLMLNYSFLFFCRCMTDVCGFQEWILCKSVLQTSVVHVNVWFIYYYNYIPLTISSTEWVNMCYLQKLCRVLFCTVKVMLGTAFCRKQAFCRE